VSLFQSSGGRWRWLGSGLGDGEDRGYRRRPLISDGGLEEVEVEALRDQQWHGGRCSVVWTERTSGGRQSGLAAAGGAERVERSARVDCGGRGGV
jgi:hypothetical protein